MIKQEGEYIVHRPLTDNERENNIWFEHMLEGEVLANSTTVKELVEIATDCVAIAAQSGIDLTASPHTVYSELAYHNEIHGTQFSQFENDFVMYAAMRMFRDLFYRN